MVLAEEGLRVVGEEAPGVSDAVYQTLRDFEAAGAPGAGAAEAAEVLLTDGRAAGRPVGGFEAACWGAPGHLSHHAGGH